MKHFDRYEILTNHYISEIKKWDWKWIVKDAKENCGIEDDQIIGSCLLGSVLSLFPSGKYYMPWCSNQTRHDVIRDTCFFDALEKVASEYDMFVTSGEGDTCDLFARLCLDYDDSLKFVTNDDYEQAIELFAE